jgi:molecular chaperone DnaK (HSP70)
MEDEDGVMVKIIERNSVIPNKQTSPFTTVEDNQQSVLFRVFEGERKIAKYNHLLGEFSLKVPPAPKGVPEIRVTFQIDVDGILFVSAKDVASANSQSITISQDRGIRNDNDVTEMVNKAKNAEEEDRKFIERVEARQELDHYASSVKSSIFSFKDKLKKTERDELTDAVEKVLKWLKHNRDREAEVYTKKKRALEEVVAPVMAKLYKQSGGGNKNGRAPLSDDDVTAEKGKMFSDAEDGGAGGKESVKSGEFDSKLDEVPA